MIEDYAELQAILKVFTYRPGWKFRIFRDLLVVEAMVVDTDNTSRNIPLSFSHGLPSFVSEDFPWDRWLLAQIMEIERHEAQEFFKIDGVKVFDPHKNGD